MTLAAWRALSRRERGRLPRELVFVAGLTALALADRWLLGFSSKDLLFLQSEFAAEMALGGGGDPLVSTATGLGRPILGHPLSALLTPFSCALLLPATALAVHLFVALHVAWGALWWTLLLRRAPHAARDGAWWARGGAVLATLNGFALARIGGEQGIEYALAAAWLPCVLYGVHELVRRRRPPLAPAVLVGLGGSAMVTLCPNLAVAGALTAAVFALVCLAPRWRQGVAAPALALGAAGGLALVMALPELLAALETLSSNDHFTYRFVEGNYRFRPYDTEDFLRVFAGLGEPEFGRTRVFGVLSLLVLTVAIALGRRVRALPVAGAVVLLMTAADWAAHGLGFSVLAAAFEGVREISIAPTVDAPLMWGIVGLYAALSGPTRRGLVAIGLVAALVVSLGYETRWFRGQPGLDITSEIDHWAWTADLPDGALVADVQPLSERAYLIPDPIARERGIRTLSEDWYAALPRPFYEALPDRRRDAAALRELGASAIVTMEREEPDAADWRLRSEHDAIALASASTADGTLFKLCVAMMREERSDWDGTVRVYVPTRPFPRPFLAPTPNVATPQSWVVTQWIWPALLLALGAGLVLKR